MEVVSSIAKRALSLIADAGHLTLPEAVSAAKTEAEQPAQPPSGPSASQLFQPELQRVGCSVSSQSCNISGNGGGGGGRMGAAERGSAAAADFNQTSRQHSGGEAGPSGCRQSDEWSLSRQPTAAGGEASPAGRGGTGLGPSPEAAALLDRLKAFMDEHILPAGELHSTAIYHILTPCSWHRSGAIAGGRGAAGESEGVHGSEQPSRQVVSVIICLLEQLPRQRPAATRQSCRLRTWMLR